MHAEDAHLPSILAILAKESGYNIVTDPNVNRQEKISIHLDEVPIEQAINLVVRAVGLSYEVVGNMVSAVSVDENDGIMLISDKGTLIRTAISQIPTLGRNTQGVKVITPKDGEKLIEGVRIPPEEEEE